MSEKFYFLAKQTQVSAEKRWSKHRSDTNYTKKPEMPPVTFVGRLCKIHAV